MTTPWNYRLVGAVLAAAAVVASPASEALAQDKHTGDITEYVTADQRKANNGDKKDTLDATLATSASVSLTSNNDVVGEVDGFSTLFGLGLNGGLTYLDGPHMWTNTLSVSESWARTPVLEQFVKSNDQFQFESLYNYFLLKWFGPFGRFNLESSLFETDLVSAEPTDYAITRTDGPTQTLTGATEVALAESLEPLTLNESVGLFAEPVRTTPITWKVRIGAGARQTVADGVLAVQDDDATDPVELTELADVLQGGLEGFSGVEGKLGGGTFTYRVGASALLPFINNSPQNRSAIDLLRWGGHASLEAAVVEWMSVDYNLDVLNDPQLVDAVQVQNNLLLTFKYTLIKADEPPKPTPAERAKKLRKNAAEAEAKAAKMRGEANKIDEKIGADRPEVSPKPSDGEAAVQSDDTPAASAQ